MKYLGIVSENEINQLFNGTEIPEDATILNGMDSLNMYAQIPLQFAIVIIVFIIAILRIKKVEKCSKLKDIFKDKRIIEKLNNKKSEISKVLYVYKYMLSIPIILILITVIIAPIHEFLHGVFMYGHDVYLGICPDYGIAFAINTGSMSKLQNIVSALAPFIILGVIPFIIINILYPRKIKNKIKYIILALCVGLIMTTATPDLIATYNILNNVPNGAQIISTAEETYWYIDE
jgi:hypothetical protein